MIIPGTAAGNSVPILVAPIFWHPSGAVLNETDNHPDPMTPLNPIAVSCQVKTIAFPNESVLHLIRRPGFPGLW